MPRKIGPHTHRRHATETQQHQRDAFKQRVRDLSQVPTETLQWRTVINRMSGFQRNQWARAGYPGLRHHEIDQAWVFARRVFEPTNVFEWLANWRRAA